MYEASSAKPAVPNGKAHPFLSDVNQLRERARTNIEKGPVTPSYEGNLQQTIEILQSVLATVLVCTLRYTMNAITATGIYSEGVKKEFVEHAREEHEHALKVAERINQLGGKPDFNPQNLATKSAAQYVEKDDLVDMIKENLSCGFPGRQNACQRFGNGGAAHWTTADNPSICQSNLEILPVIFRNQKCFIPVRRLSGGPVKREYIPAVVGKCLHSATPACACWIRSGQGLGGERFSVVHGTRNKKRPARLAVRVARFWRVPHDKNISLRIRGN